MKANKQLTVYALSLLNNFAVNVINEEIDYLDRELVDETDKLLEGYITNELSRYSSEQIESYRANVELVKQARVYTTKALIAKFDKRALEQQVSDLVRDSEYSFSSEALKYSSFNELAVCDATLAISQTFKQIIVNYVNSKQGYSIKVLKSLIIAREILESIIML